MSGDTQNWGLTNIQIALGSGQSDQSSIADLIIMFEDSRDMNISIAGNQKTK